MQTMQTTMREAKASRMQGSRPARPARQARQARPKEVPVPRRLTSETGSSVLLVVSSSHRIKKKECMGWNGGDAQVAAEA